MNNKSARICGCECGSRGELEREKSGLAEGG